jgi:hypothetical protein
VPFVTLLSQCWQLSFCRGLSYIISVLPQREHDQRAESAATSTMNAAIQQQLLRSNFEFEICSHQNDSCILLGIIVSRLQRKRINGSSQAASRSDKSTFAEMIVVCAQSQREFCVRNIACLEWVPSLTHFGHMMLFWPCFTNEHKCLAHYGFVLHAAGFFLDKYAYTWVWQIVLCHMPPAFWSNQRQFVLQVFRNMCIVTRVRPLPEKAMVCYISSVSSSTIVNHDGIGYFGLRSRFEPSALFVIQENDINQFTAPFTFYCWFEEAWLVGKFYVIIWIALGKITFFKSPSYPMCRLQSNPRVEFNNHTAGSRREILPHEQHHVFMLKPLAWPFTWCFWNEILVNYDIIWSIAGLVYLAILCTAPLDVLHSTSQIPQDATLSISSSSLVCNRPCGTYRAFITSAQICTYAVILR